VIQANTDPVVDPISGKIIYEKIHSSQKLLQEMDFNNHVIINCERRAEVFNVIKYFLGIF
jgi:esterase/lipase